MVDAYRTPDERFENLPDFPFEPRYIDDLAGYEGLRMHYVDEGPADAERVYLCLHGEPTWSYLYRKMIPIFAAAGRRVIAPDLFGFGRSDKPTEDAVYSFDFHRESLLRLVERLDLRGITLVVQDWGGLIGLTLPLDIADRIDGVITMNTALVTGDMELPPSFFTWRTWVADHPDMDAAEAMMFLDYSVPREAFEAYRAPFPNKRSKAGARAFPAMVPTELDAPGAEIARRARDWWTNEWSGQALVATGIHDRLGGVESAQLLASQIKDCPPVFEVIEGGHFCQERGEGVARKYLELYGS